MARPVVQVQRPTFEHHHNGIGVQCNRPRISWRFHCTDENVFDWEQFAYDLEIRDEVANKSETFHVESQHSVLVPWPASCAPLQSRSRRQVRVKCHGTSTEGAGAVEIGVTEWSEWSTVEVALLHADDWKAQMISPPSSLAYATDGSARPLLLRKCFDLPGGYEIATARLYVTSHGVYQSFLNGDHVGDHFMAPGWQSYNHRLHYQLFDVTQMLEAGCQNVLGFEVGAGWFASALTWAHRRFTYGQELAVLAQLEVFFKHGDRCTIVSDESWICHPSSTVSSEIFSGEIFDSNLERELDGWNTFAAFNDQQWHPVTLSRQRPARLVSPEAAPMRITQRMRPCKIWTLPDHKTLIDFGQNIVGRVRVRRVKRPSNTKVVFRHAEVLEDGRLCTKSLGDASATDTIICDGNLITDWAPRFTFHGFRYIEIAGWSPTDKDEPLTSTSLFAEVVHSDMDRKGWFSCSDESVIRLHENAVWSMRGNFLSVPIGAPQRNERLGWTGDLNIFAPSAAFLYDITALLREWLEDLEADQMEDSPYWTKGVVPLVVPNCVVKKQNVDNLWCATPMGVWGDAVVMVPWVLYNTSGDIEILQRRFNSLAAWLDNGIPRGVDNLWDEATWQFGDWLDSSAPINDSGRGRTEGTLVADMYLYHITQRASEIASLIGNEEATARYRQQSVSIRQNLQFKYLTSASLTLSDSQTSYALALAFGIIDEPSKCVKAASRLVRNIKHNDFHPTGGFVGTHYLLPVLTQFGYADVAYRMLLENTCPSFLYPVHMGATTIWERWDSILPPSQTIRPSNVSVPLKTLLSNDPGKRNSADDNNNHGGRINPASMNSFNHCAFGSVVHWLHSSVGGISSLTPGWRTFLVRPTPNIELEHAEVAYEGPYGRIECRWTLDGKTSIAFNVHSEETSANDESGSVRQESLHRGFEKVENKSMLMKVYLLVPPNSRALVVLPGKQVTAPFEATSTRTEESEAGQKDGGVWVGSGRHVFETVFVQRGVWPPDAFLPPWGRASY